MIPKPVATAADAPDALDIAEIEHCFDVLFDELENANEPERTQLSSMIAKLQRLGKQAVLYPNYEARRAEFERSMHRANLEARGLAIEEELQDPFTRPETANELLDELFGIDKELEKIGE